MNQWLISLVVFLLALPYLALPLLIKANMSMKARPLFRKVELSQLPQSCLGFFQAKVAELEKLGFRHLAVLEAPQSGSNVQNYLVLMSMEAEQVLALITGVVGVVSQPAAADSVACDAPAAMPGSAADSGAGIAPAAMPKASAPSVLYLEFLSCFANDTRISSMNSPELGSFPSRSDREILQVPQIQSSEELLRFHRAAVRDLAGGLTAKMPESDDWAAYTQNELSLQFDWVEKNTGLLRLDETKENYRPSWYGAYKLTWMELWPFKPIRIARMKAHAASLQRKYLA